MDCRDGFWIAYCYFLRRDADDGTVLLMESVDVVNAVTGHYMVLQDKVSELGVPWAGDLAEW